MNFEKRTNTYKIIMLVIITAMITFLFTSIGMYNYYTKKDNVNIKELSKKIDNTTSSADDISNKIQIIKKYLDKSYIGEMNEDKMLQGAIKGYVAGIGDEYTGYLTEEELEDLMINVTGNYVGIGIYMTLTKDGDVIILTPIENSPAEEKGLKTGDIIKKVDGVECNGMSLEDVSKMVKGEEGTTVNLEILREEKTLNVSVERRTVELKYVDSKVLEGNIGYIQMLSFDTECTKKFKEALNKMQEQNITSLIIDLRDNGGGLVEEAINMADLFVPNGKVIMKSYNKDKIETITEAKNTKKYNFNIVVLVNESSASATEIFTAALKENNIAKIVGKKTYGKGVMQELQTISIGGALKVTIEEFKTPNGNKINKVGITPDIEVEGTEEQLQAAINALK